MSFKPLAVENFIVLDFIIIFVPFTIEGKKYDWLHLYLFFWCVFSIYLFLFFKRKMFYNSLVMEKNLKCSNSHYVIYLSTCYFYHGSIIWTGITFKKNSCYMRKSACMWLIAENAKRLPSYIKLFWIFSCERNCRILIGSCKQVLMNHPTMFLDGDN